MTATGAAPGYVLGNSDSEHERLIRQATYLAPVTRQFFREAGICRGMRVLDIGSGMGDVAMLAARLVGPSGEVVGIEREARAIARARARAAHAGLENVSFIQTDVWGVEASKSFDALVGRFILMFLPGPAEILRSLARLVRPGGVVAFQEASWAYLLEHRAQLPLWSATLRLAHETLQRSGADTEMGIGLHRLFQEAGLPVPAMKLEVPLDSDGRIVGMLHELFGSLLPGARRLGLPFGALGDLSTLLERLQTEVAASHSAVSYIGLVGAWARK